MDRKKKQADTKLSVAEVEKIIFDLIDKRKVKSFMERTLCFSVCCCYFLFSHGKFYFSTKCGM